MLKSMTRLMNARLLLAGAAVAALGAAGAADGAVIVYSAILSGPNEAPPNASPGTGSATVTVDTTLHTMRVEAMFSGLLGSTTACHIHALTAVPFAGTAGVATAQPTFPGFPAGVMAGSYDMTFDMTMASSYNPAFVTANGGTPASAEAALFGGMAAGRTYFNIHSSVFGGGEIRGFLVPSPSALALMGLSGLCAMRRRRN